MRRVGEPAVEIGKVVESMDLIKDFRQWVMEDFLDVYIKFRRNSFDSFCSKIGVEKYNKMSRAGRYKELLKHFSETGVYILNIVLKCPVCAVVELMAM